LELKIDVFALLDSFSNGKEDCCLDAWLSVEVADAAAARRKCENEDGIFCAYGIEQCEHDVARFATASNKVEQARIKIDTEKVKRERMEAELRREPSSCSKGSGSREERIRESRKGRFLKRGDERRAADQARVGRDLSQQNVSNKTRLRKRNSIVRGQNRQEQLREEGV
jgi:hypothetical protein